MKKRVAIPVTNEQLSEYFGECSHYEIFETDGKIVDRKEAKFPAGTVATELPGWLEEIGITDVITFKVNPKIINLFASKKVNLFVGVPIDSPQNLIEAYLQGKLESDEKIIQEITVVTNN
ncbi:NifB/NifX family molybdenum-iron cluster-binding protein [Mariniphaga sp.]|uniref:NifB/NifX family molybdenum-iron cluster-binding protein n=1 Tax=Mariniphaga sp. TaxID=1954475 RepID=UPI00356268A7